MDWIKEHYDKAALFAAALIAVASAVFIGLNTSAFPAAFEGRDSSKPKDNTIAPPPVESIQAAAAIVQKPREWAAYEGSLLVSRPYVLKDGRLVDPLEGGAQLHPPVPNAWLIQHGLDYADSAILDLDADNDGFSNLEEFQGGTSPVSGEATPPFHTKLRLAKFIAIPFRLMFTASPDDGTTFTVNSKDAKRRTQFLQVGDTIEGSPYKVLSYEKKSETKNEIENDVSELTIQNTETGQKIILVRGREANDPTSFAEFTNQLDGKTFKVKKDEEFTLEQEPGRKYKLIDISESEAVIQDVAGGEQIKIPKN